MYGAFGVAGGRDPPAAEGIVAETDGGCKR